MADQVKNIHQRLAAITGAVGAVQKTGKNTEQKYDYIEYDAVTAALRGLMFEHGVTVLQNMKEGGRKETEITSKFGAKGVLVVIDYIFTVTNVDDPSDKLEFLWQGEASDYGDKATNKAATAAEKYFLLKLFKIGTKDDPDSESPDRGVATTSAPKQAEAEPTAIANWQVSNIRIAARKIVGKKSDAEVDAFIEKAIGIPLMQIPAKSAQKVVEKLNAAAESKKQKAVAEEPKELDQVVEVDVDAPINLDDIPQEFLNK